jgi:hypothetical protein
MIENFLLKLDFLGPKPTLYIDKHERYRTASGGLMSIILGILTILCFIGFGMDLFQRKKPSTLLTKIYDSYPKVEYNRFKFLLAPAYNGPRKMNDIKRKLSFTYTYHQADSTLDVPCVNYTYYDMVPCTEINFFEKNPEFKLSTLVPKEDYYCVPENFDLPLEGKFGNSKFKMYHINVNFCNNKTMNNTCFSTDEIKNDLAEFYIHYIYLDNYIDHSDYVDPIKKLHSSDLLQGSAKAARTDQYWYRLVNVITDSGWFLEESGDLESFQLDSRNNFINAVSPRFIYLIQISLNTISDIYKRRYVKIQDIFANIGGIIKSMTILLLMFNHLFINKLYYQFIYFKFIDKENAYRGINNHNSSLNLKKEQINTYIGISELKSSTHIYNVKSNYINTNKTLNLQSFDLTKPKTNANLKFNKKISQKFKFCELVGLCKSQSFKEKHFLIKNVEKLQIKSLNVLNLIKNLQTLKIIRKMFFREKANLLNLFSFSHVLYKANNFDKKVEKINKPIFNNEELLKIKNQLKIQESNGEVINFNNLLLNHINLYLDE